MEWLVYVMISIQFICLLFGFYCLKLTKSSNIKEVSKFLKKFMKILLVTLIVAYSISIISSFIQFYNSFLVSVLLVEAIINFYIIIEISKHGIKFIDNLNNDLIFIKDNSNCLLEIARLFILYSLINGIAGITLTIIKNIIDSPNFDYTISISTSFFMYILIGMVFYIIHLLFERSIEIYEENQLTI